MPIAAQDYAASLNNTNPRIFEDLAFLYPLWRDTCLGTHKSWTRETEFLESLFRNCNQITSIIDLGCGVGLHSRELSRAGYLPTLFDKSVSALAIAAAHLPACRIINADFESISLAEEFDASVCMWSSSTYILDDSARTHFFGWVATHTRNIVVVDQPNFPQYPHISNSSLHGENDLHSLTVTRKWTIQRSIKTTSWIYNVSNKATNDRVLYEDYEVQQYLRTSDIAQLLGPLWRLDKVYGDYDLTRSFSPSDSRRMISVFKRC